MSISLLDPATALRLEGGYYHFVDTSLCGTDGSAYILIDGAMVRLIRFGSALQSERKTTLRNATVVVNSGSLHYLNKSHPLDDFGGALTVIFNNGTYADFKYDYSVNKIHPRGGKYVVISPAHAGMRILPTETAGTFFVSGAETAYVLSPDGDRVFYSADGVLRLPEGIHTVAYMPVWDMTALPAPADGVWQDDGMGTLTAVPETPVVHVSPNGNDSADGSEQHPLLTIPRAVAMIGDRSGTVRLHGILSFTPPLPHKGVITYRGDGKQTYLVFEQACYYYLTGDTVFDNLTIRMYSEQSAIVSDGHAVRYTARVETTVHTYLLHSTPTEAIRRSRLTHPRFYTEIGEVRRDPSRHLQAFYCLTGKATVTHGQSLLEVPAGTLLFMRCTQPYTVECDSDTVLFGASLLTEKPLRIRQKRVVTSSGALFRQMLLSARQTPALLQDTAFLNTLAERIMDTLSTDDNRVRIAFALRNYIESNYADIHAVEELADEFHLNRIYLEREYKKVYKISLKQALTACKIDAAKTLLEKGYTVEQTAHLVGYDLPATFSRVFREKTGHAPSIYAKNLI